MFWVRDAEDEDVAYDIVCFAYRYTSGWKMGCLRTDQPQAWVVFYVWPVLP